MQTFASNCRLHLHAWQAPAWCPFCQLVACEHLRKCSSCPGRLVQAGLPEQPAELANLCLPLNSHCAAPRNIQPGFSHLLVSSILVLVGSEEGAPANRLMQTCEDRTGFKGAFAPKNVSQCLALHAFFFDRSSLSGPLPRANFVSPVSNEGAWAWKCWRALRLPDT